MNLRLVNDLKSEEWEEMEDRAQLQQYLQDIERWEREQQGLWFWEKLGRLPFVLLDKLTPSFIQKRLLY